MRSEAAAQVLSCRQAVDDPFQPLAKSLLRLMPRTFRHVSERKNNEILSVFPMLKSEFWDEPPSLTYRAVSIWDRWLYSTDDEHLLEASSDEEYAERCAKFATLDRSIASNTNIYLVSGRPWPRFKELRDSEHLIHRLSPRYRKGGWMLVLPDLQIIYTSGDGDEHTRVTYFRDAKLAEPFDEWVEKAGLKYIGGNPPTN
jgi:hypothetical protein